MTGLFFAVVQVQGVVHQAPLLFVMQLRVPGRRRCRGFPTGVVEGLVLTHGTAEVMLSRVPGALVLGLFLAPDYPLGVGVAATQQGAELLLRERIELLDAD